MTPDRNKSWPVQGGDIIGVRRPVDGDIQRVRLPDGFSGRVVGELYGRGPNSRIIGSLVFDGEEPLEVGNLSICSGTRVIVWSSSRRSRSG